MGVVGCLGQITYAVFVYQCIYPNNSRKTVRLPLNAMMTIEQNNQT